MDKQYIESEKKRLAKKAEIQRGKIIEKINSAAFLTKQDKRDLVEIFVGMTDESDSTFESLAMTRLLRNHKGERGRTLDFRETDRFLRSLEVGGYRALISMSKDGMDRFLDSEKVEFDGDIIITDPFYIMRPANSESHPVGEDDLETCECGENMGALGLRHCMLRDTLYGDWGCAVLNEDTGEVMGEFCADTAQVAVFLLDEVLKYNPSFDYHITKKWTTALIPDFKGTVQFTVEYEKSPYAEKEWQDWLSYSVHVVGHGINKKTGELINFRSEQTSL